MYGARVQSLCVMWERERWPDTSANDSPLPAGELWQRSAETPGSSASLSFFPLCWGALGWDQRQKKKFDSLAGTVGVKKINK